MIIGIGVDLVSIERFMKSFEKPRFAKWVFSEEERELFDKKTGEGKRNETAAANFAAKEAFLKAAGVGLGGFALHEICALRNEAGMPYYVLKGKAAEYVEKNKLTVHLSLTHENMNAMAFAVFEKN
jgi:holo-[acyl-carrier protein] synthase